MNTKLMINTHVTHFYTMGHRNIVKLAMAISHHNITTILMSMAPTTIVFTTIALPPIPRGQPIMF
jgi:hypothetical protein